MTKQTETKTLPEIQAAASTLWQKIDECKTAIKADRLEYRRSINRGNAETADKRLASIRDAISDCQKHFSELDSLRLGLVKIENSQAEILSAARVDLVESQDNLRAAQLACQTAEGEVGRARNAVTPLNILRENLHVSDSDRNFDSE